MPDKDETLGRVYVDMILSMTSSHGDYFDWLDAEDVNERYKKIGYNVLFYPSNSKREHRADLAHAFESVAIDIVIYASIGFLVTKLAEGFFTEAGSDAYKYVKKLCRFSELKQSKSETLADLISELFCTNILSSYNMNQNLSITSKLGLDHVVIKITLEQDELEEDPEFQRLRDERMEKIEKLIDMNEYALVDLKIRKKIQKEYEENLFPVVRNIVNKKLSSLLKDWKMIEDRIEALELGTTKTAHYRFTGSVFHIIESDGERWSISMMRRPSDNPPF